MTAPRTVPLARWRELAATNGFLSPRFVGRYAVALTQAAAISPAERIAAAEKIARCDPSRALAHLLGTERPMPPHHGPWRIITGGAADVVVADLLSEQPDLDAAFAVAPRLEQTWVPLHPDRHAHLLVHSEGSCVALRWQAKSVQQRQENQDQIAAIAQQASAGTGVTIRVWSDYTICASDAEHSWVVSPNLGITVEDLLRCLPQGHPDRALVVAGAAALRSVMVEAGVVWQGFAPRNMFLREGQLLLIDFEEVVRPETDARRATECLLWHRVFFADCLFVDEARKVFGAEPAWAGEIQDDLVIPADAFEQDLLTRKTVTWRERRTLLATSARLEGRHARPAMSERGPYLFGHELGHFWGDFAGTATETQIFRHLSTVDDDEVLVGCLEAFEVAMEADIIAMVRRQASDLDTTTTAERTAVLTRLLAARGATALARCREASADWYRRLDEDPGRLLDEVLFRLTTQHGDQDVALAELIMGMPGTAPASSRALVSTLEVGLNYLHRAERGEGVLTHADADTLRTMFSEPLPRDGMPFAALLEEMAATVVPYSISQSHPGYLAFPDSGNALGAVAGGILGRLLNQNLIAVDRSAPAATFVEIQVIEWLRTLVGYPQRELTELRGVKDVGGLWTTGGHLSNHVAMLAALGATFSGVRRHGLRSLDSQPSVVMAGPIAHYSHSDSAFHLGLGWDAILPVAAGCGFTTDVEAVAETLADPPAGRTPFMVVGVAGNCRTTGLDDLHALGEVCRRHGVWFHVDACHGGSLIFSDRLREEHLRGLELADSIALDPHKGLFTPYPSSYVLFRNPEVLTQFSRHEATVRSEDCWDLGLITPFLGSRGFESLATWTMLRHVGVGRLGALVEHRQAFVRHLQRRLDDSGLFVGLNDVDFYRLAFVLCPPEARAVIRGLDGEARRRAVATVSGLTSQLNTALYEGGEVCFDEHTLADLANRVGAGTATYTVMAACPGNPGLTLGDLNRAIDRLVVAAVPFSRLLVDTLRSDGQAAPGQGIGGPAGWGQA